DAMVELGDQQALVLLQLLALSDVSRQALDAQEAPTCIKLAPRCLLQPHLSAVRTAKAESQGVGRVVRAESADSCLEAPAIVGMDVPEEIVMRRLGHAASLKSKNVSAVIAPRKASGSIPLEGHHLAGCHCVRQTRLTLLFGQEGQFKRCFIAS